MSVAVPTRLHPSQVLRGAYLRDDRRLYLVLGGRGRVQVNDEAGNRLTVFDEVLLEDAYHGTEHWVSMKVVLRRMDFVTTSSVPI